MWYETKKNNKKFNLKKITTQKKTSKEIGEKQYLSIYMKKKQTKCTTKLNATDKQVIYT